VGHGESGGTRCGRRHKRRSLTFRSRLHTFTRQPICCRSAQRPCLPRTLSGYCCIRPRVMMRRPV
jgi:hypothetical protein